MNNIFESVKDILEKSIVDKIHLDALTKVMLSTKHSYNAINAVRSKLDTPAGDVLLGIVATIANNTSLFNAFVSEFKKGIGVTEDNDLGEMVDKRALGAELQDIKKRIKAVQASWNRPVFARSQGTENYDKLLKRHNEILKSLKEGWSELDEDFQIDEITLTEEEHAALMEDRLQNDIKSLKRIGWKLDKVIPFMVTKSSEYGVKITSDLITMYYNDGGAKPKKVSWPKDPPKNKVDDAGHAEAYLAQAVDSEESPDIYGMEAYQLLTTAGYNERAAMAVMRNMGWDADVKSALNRTSKFAKKTK